MSASSGECPVHDAVTGGANGTLDHKLLGALTVHSTEPYPAPSFDLLAGHECAPFHFFLLLCALGLTAMASSVVCVILLVLSLMLASAECGESSAFSRSISQDSTTLQESWVVFNNYDNNDCTGVASSGTYHKIDTCFFDGMHSNYYTACYPNGYDEMMSCSSNLCIYCTKQFVSHTCKFNKLSSCAEALPTESPIAYQMTTRYTDRGCTNSYLATFVATDCQPGPVTCTWQDGYEYATTTVCILPRPTEAPTIPPTTEPTTPVPTASPPITIEPTAATQPPTPEPTTSAPTTAIPTTPVPTTPIPTTEVPPTSTSTPTPAPQAADNTVLYIALGVSGGVIVGMLVLFWVYILPRMRRTRASVAPASDNKEALMGQSAGYSLLNDQQTVQA